LSLPEGDTTADLSAKLERTFVEGDTGELVGVRPIRMPAIEAHLILFAHPENQMLGRRYRLPPGAQLEIGRATGAGISMPDVRSLSRLHARLGHLGDVVLIEDLESTNGTYVNDEKVSGSRRLRSGDRFQVGAVHFKFLHEKDPETAYHEAIHQLVMCDGLTGIFNKRKFEEELEREFGRGRRHERPLSLVFFDIDHFKTINDTYGHLCGDYVLQQISKQTQPYLRPEQVFARVGGEEFAILCPETQSQQAVVLADKLRQRFAAERYAYGDQELQITCSFGVAELDGSLRTPADLYHAADQAMYRSKREGRDRVSLHPRTPGTQTKSQPIVKPTVKG
jgi:two-component system, cell cycle response regulator